MRSSFRAKANSVIDGGAVAFGEMFGLHLCMSERHNYQAAAPNHPLFKVLADVAAERGVSIDLHTEAVPHDAPMPSNLQMACSKNPAQLLATIPQFEELLAHNRNANIVWQHIGWDNTGYLTVDLWRQLLGKHKNLYLAIRVETRVSQVGGGGPMPNRIVDENSALRPEWASLFRDYAGRIMVGGDEFVAPPMAMSGGIASIAPKSFDATWQVVKELDASTAASIGGANAARIYHLE